ncbi:MAG: C40 family peptidase [Clostridiales bacterium]|nr:C40 family peptidase [Clostridiales bacterium]
MDRLGKPYVKGGESDEEGGYDTSGLVYACLIEVGESVSRKTSRDYAKMENWTLITSYDAFQPGDLLFFRDAPEGEINVVAICIGGGEMIYASSSRGEVIRCSYRTNYWQSVFAHARRVF